jgi:hypothetical protein
MRPATTDAQVEPASSRDGGEEAVSSERPQEHDSSTEVSE